MDHIPLAVEEEIALEGLDGITLESFWFRLSERLQIPLPFHQNLKKSLWNIVLKKEHYEFYEIETPRKTVGHLDRVGLLNNEQRAVEEATESYHIYSYHPVDDKSVRGSCSEFKTRVKINRNDLARMELSEVVNTFGDKLVTVASQKLRNRVLIPSNIGRDCDINNHAYCILERIGRSRYFGETTSGPFSLLDFVKDSKLLHYFRTCLLKNNTVLRQQIVQRINNKSLITQIFHLPKYYVVVRTSELLQVEKLFAFLLSKPNHIATNEEVRESLNVKTKKSFISVVRNRGEVFEYKKFRYREIYPNADKNEYSFKSGHEKTLWAVKLVDPNLDIFQLYEKEEKEPAFEDENEGFLDCSRQQLKLPLVYQVLAQIEKSGSRGMSQSDIGKFFGLSKLNSRAVLRRAQKFGLQTYVKDEGRQRTTMFVGKKHANEKSKQIVSQVAKLFKKAEENCQTTVQITTLEPSRHNDQENNLVPITEPPKEPSPTKIIIPLNNLKQESNTNKEKSFSAGFLKHEACTSSVIQFVQPQTEEVESCLPESRHLNKFTLMPNDDYSFVDNVENVEVSLRFLNNIPGLPKQSRGLQEDFAKNRVSEKVLVRMNIILDAIKEKKVIDIVSLLMIVRKQEENFSEIICRKSLLGLCSRLAADNFIKVIEMELTSSTKSVKLTYFGEPNITFDLRCWHSIIEEQKIHHFISTMNRPAETPAVELPNNPLVHTDSFISQASVALDEFGPQSPMHENFPKFLKYRLFHEFLYYLIYGYPENVEKIQIKRAVDIWRRENQRLNDYDEIAEKISICYSTDINWKMFIPPLNPQLGYEKGWGFLRDIIHRIPLILYVKFTRYGHLAPEINEYLTHPIKSNYLLHFLPPKMYAKLTQGRKSVLVITELCKRLCMMGLLQFGPNRTKEVDQCYIYLNRNATLLDTRSSSPGYLEVSEKEYPKRTFHFNCDDTVSSYWSSMQEICTNTRINQKSTAFGQTIVLEQLNTKPVLLKALKPQTATTAPENDIGDIPGDGKGAGGLDKIFMAHLKQNWSKSVDRKKRPISALAIERKPKAKVLKKEKIKDEPKKRKRTSAKVKAAVKEVNKSKAILQSNLKGVSVKSKIIRKIVPKRQTVKELKKRSEQYDKVDKEALKLMKTLRVTWSDIEDKTLCLTKVALKFAFPNDNQCAHYINSTLVRDVLHWKTEKALNKTSRACQRRTFNLMKNNKAFREQTFLYLEELRANREFFEKYNNFAERLKKLYNQEQIYLVMKVHIVEMVHRMHQIFLKQYISNPLDVSCASEGNMLSLPANYDDLLVSYTIINPNNSLDNFRYQEPANSNEVEISILASLIHGACCTTNDKISNSFFLHETYSKFSDDNLGAAVNLLRRLTIVSLNKNQRNKKPIMPRTISPFHLSNRYASQLLTVHVPVDLYDEYLQAMREISSGKNTYQMKSVNCGWLYMLAEMINQSIISLRTDRHDKIRSVDMPMKRKTNFEKISDNYMQMMRKQSELKSDNKLVKTVRFQPDSNSDEKFIYTDDPLELFCRLDTIYLHIFCILQAIEHNENVRTDEWKLTESDKCSLKNCIIRSGDNFPIEVQKIACHGYEIIKHILCQNDQGPSKYDENMITKFNIVKYFDSVINKYHEENAENTRKNLGKAINSDMRQAISTNFLLRSIQRIATEVDTEDGAWLCEYKKISLYKTAEEDVFDDDEDAEQSKNIAKLSSQKDLNPSKPTDSFVVNLSSLLLSINIENQNESVTIDGDAYSKSYVPFDDDTRQKILDEIKRNFYIWMPEDLQKMSLDEELKNSQITLSEEDREQLEQIYNGFLKIKNRMGATAAELLERFKECNKQQLTEYLDILIKLKFVLKTGVNEYRFVQKNFAAFWLIDTFYLSAKDDEPISPARKKTKVDEADKLLEVARDVETKEEVFEDTERNYKRNPFCVLPYPWIRVGSLNRIINRRCFDKWLGSVLNYVSVNPGILLPDLCARFNVLTPVHVRNLCEVLEIIGCIKLMAFPDLKPSIFSEYNPSEDEVKAATILDSFGRTYIEVNPDAFRRLTFFIGKKKYKLPFI